MLVIEGFYCCFYSQCLGGSVACTWVSCCFFFTSVCSACLWLYAHMYLCVSIFICHSVSALLSLFPFKCRSCISFWAQMNFSLLYTEGKGNVGIARVSFTSCLTKGFTIQKCEWRRKWDYFFSFLSLLSTVFCLLSLVIYFHFPTFSPIRLQTLSPITNVLSVIYPACT